MIDPRILLVGGMIDCPLCGGGGKMLTITCEPAGEFTEEESDCPGCFGTGKVRDMRCAHCGQPVTVALLAAFDLGLSNDLDLDE